MLEYQNSLLHCAILMQASLNSPIIANCEAASFNEFLLESLCFDKQLHDPRNKSQKLKS